MPSYDFRCPECDERFEVTLPVGTANNVCCPVCEAPAKRVFTPVGVVFKGSGFHNTDYRSHPKDDAPAPKSDSSAPTSDTPSCAGSDGGGCAGCPAAS
jgi:putative FmdB family regulatory protein